MEIILKPVNNVNKKYILVILVKLMIFFYGIFSIVLFVENVKKYFIEVVWNQKKNVPLVYALKKVIN